MKPQQIAWIVRGGVTLLALSILAAVGSLLFQGVYWLKFDKWYDWTAPEGPAISDVGTQGASWKGIEEISSWAVSAPTELWTFGAAIILLVLFTVVRIAGRR